MASACFEVFDSGGSIQFTYFVEESPTGPSLRTSDSICKQSDVEEAPTSVGEGTSEDSTSTDEVEKEWKQLQNEVLLSLESNRQLSREMCHTYLETASKVKAVNEWRNEMKAKHAEKIQQKINAIKQETEQLKKKSAELDQQNKKLRRKTFNLVVGSKRQQRIKK